MPSDSHPAGTLDSTSGFAISDHFTVATDPIGLEYIIGAGVSLNGVGEHFRTKAIVFSREIQPAIKQQYLRYPAAEVAPAVRSRRLPHRVALRTAQGL